jgi:transposase InsO family protein
VEAEKGRYPVRLLCRCLEVSRAGFYAWRQRAPSERAREDARLAVEIAAAHAESRRTYGSPRVHRELRAQGRRVSRKRVARLMRERGLRVRRRRRFPRTTDSNHALAVAPNVLARRFAVSAPNTVWAGDITYVATREGWLYLAVLLDLFSRRVVGYAVSDRITRELVLEALQRALPRREGRTKLLHHSDRGSQYASGEYRELLERERIACSMSRRGNCWDNAVVESFFGTLKYELLAGRELASREETTAAIGEYIESFYNTRRRHSALGYVSPVAFELQYARRKRAA